MSKTVKKKGKKAKLRREKVNEKEMRGNCAFGRTGKKIRDRYYDKKGRAKKDIDYTDHGNPKDHPKVPHEHFWDWSDPDNPIRSKTDD